MAVEKINGAGLDAVLHTGKPVLLDFYADWCGPCRMLSPLVDEVSEERPDVACYKVNVDEEVDLAVRFSVASIPTLVFLKNGEVAGTSVGYCTKSNILALLEK